jgi:hypothetical protein
MHTQTHVLLLLPTPILHLYVTEKKNDKKEKEKKKEKEIKNGRPDKKDKKTVARTFSLSCSPVLFFVARFILALRRVPRPPEASSLLYVSRSSRQQPQQQQ